MKTANIKNGSALIMTIVLTVLLAILGAVFVLMARMEKTATSARSESEELKLAADSIVATISQRLADDVPKPPNASGFQPDYCDYPGRWWPTGNPNPDDANDCWLANLEPEDNGGYRWRHISDVYNRFGTDAYDVGARIRDDYPKTIDTNTVNLNNLADADGDGVSDARWVKVPDLTTSKGKPIYAAVRIVDNGGMLNVNTAYKFDPCNPGTNGVNVDGSSQMQINLAALAKRGSTTSPAERLFNERVDASGRTVADGGKNNTTVPTDANYWNYASDVVWHVQPIGTYTPFDISDELKLRNRYILGDTRITTRIETVWDNVYDDFGLTVPRTDQNQLATNGNYWFYKANYSSIDPNQYDYRHISTTYNVDRLIAPDGRPMVWINTPNIDSNDVYTRLAASIDPNDPLKLQREDEYAQLAVNIRDYVDRDANIASLTVNGKTYYGLERPFIYITELAWNVWIDNAVTPPIPHRSYAIEVYSRLSGGQEPNLMINGTKISNAGTFVGSDGSYYVFRSEDALAPLTVTDPNTIKTPATTVSFDVNDAIKLVCSAGGDTIVIDSVRVPSWFDANAVGQHSYQRDMRTDRLIQRAWATSDSNSPTLGSNNSYTSNVKPLQVFCANDRFRNVGDIGLMFRKPAYYKDGTSNADVIGYDPNNRIEENVRINLADPNVQKIFKYITAFNPSLYDPNNGTRIKGRININTAPWFVIKQLPWVGLRNNTAPTYDANALAKAIVAYRDKLDISTSGGPNYFHSNAVDSRYQETNIAGINELPGLRSIGELTTVINNTGKDDYSMRYYTIGGNSTKTGNDIHYPDLTTADTGSSDLVAGDFEKRNLIFARISDLVTVRSDVFTAYILIRLGENGPQRRVVAILDRSEAISGGGKVKIVALQEVPDAR